MRIIRDVTGTTEDKARQALERTGDVKSAIVMLKLACSPEEAKRKASAARSLREIIG